MANIRFTRSNAPSGAARFVTRDDGAPFDIEAAFGPDGSFTVDSAQWPSLVARLDGNPRTQRAGGEGSVVAPQVSPAATASGPGLSLIDCWGHSYPGAGGVVRGDYEAYPWVAARALGAARLNNRALGGSISCWPQKGAQGDGGFGWVLQSCLRDSNGAPYVPRSQFIIDDQRVHDLAKLGALNPRPALEAARTKYSRYCAAAVFEADPAGASHASWAFTGTWVDFASTNANSGTGMRYTTTIGDSATFTVPADRKTENVVAIGLFLNGAHDYTVGVSVDGGAETLVRLQNTVLTEQSVNTNNLIVTLRFGRDAAGAGLAPNSPLDFPAALAGGVTHTIKLTLRTQTVAGSTFGVDFAQIEADPLDGPLLALPNTCRPQSFSPWNGWPHGPDAGTDPMTDQSFRDWDQAFTRMLAEFPNRVISVDFDSQLQRQPEFFAADLTHPNPRGHALLAQALVDAIRNSPLMTSRALTRPSPNLAVYWEPVGSYGRLAFANAWTHFGSSFPPFGVAKALDNIVFMRGATKSGSTVGSAVCAPLPAGWRPLGGSRIFVGTVNGAGATKMQPSVAPDGTVKYLNGGDITGEWFDTVIYPAET